LLIEARRGRVALLAQRLAAGLAHTAAGRREAAARVLHRLNAAALSAVSPEAVLKRGYALVFDRQGAPLVLAEAVRPGAELRLRFADGDVRAIAAGRGASRQGNLDL
jgi:exodeoxyribonuclease VII large subunit